MAQIALCHNADDLATAIDGRTKALTSPERKPQHLLQSASATKKRDLQTRRQDHFDGMTREQKDQIFRTTKVSSKVLLDIFTEQLRPVLKNHKEGLDKLKARVEALETGGAQKTQSSKPRIKFRGAWSATSGYDEGDGVVFRGQLYVFGLKHMSLTPYPDDAVSADCWIPIESPRAVS